MDPNNQPLDWLGQVASRPVLVRNWRRDLLTLCACGSLLEHWRRYAPLKEPPAEPLACSNLACSQPAELGWLVQKARSPDHAWYILPLCGACKELSGPYPVERDGPFARSRRSVTCAAKGKAPQAL